MKKLTFALLLCISLSTQAQTLLYQWAFTNASDTSTSSIPTVVATPGTGQLGLRGVSGSLATCIANGLIYFTNANSGPPGGPGGALVLNGNSYDGNYNGANGAIATNSSLNLGTLYQFTVTFWFMRDSRDAVAPGGSSTAQLPRQVQFGAVVGYDEGGKGSGNFNGVGTSLNGYTNGVGSSSFQDGIASSSGANNIVTVSGNPNFSPTGFVVDGQTWYFYAITYDSFLTSSNFTVWLASTNATTSTGTAAISPFVQTASYGSIPFTTNASVLLAGCTGAGRSMSGGQIADVRIYSGVMSSNNLQLIRSFQQPNLVVNPPAGASIQVQPVSGKTFVGGNRTFSVAAVGNPSTFTYLWRSNNVAIAAATNSSFTLSNVTASANGASFVCSVTNVIGGTNSTAGVITVVSRTAGSYANAVFTNNPYSFWLVNEPSNATSVVIYDYANGNDGSAARPVGDTFPGGASSPFYTGFPVNNTSIQAPPSGGNGPLNTPPLPIYTNSGMTICGWIYTPTTGNGTAGDNGLIYSLPSDTASGFGLTFGGGNELDYAWGSANQTGSGLTIPTAEWTFVALVISTNLTSYDTNNSVSADTNATLYIGSLSGGFNSYVDSTAQSGHLITSGTSPAVLALGRTTQSSSENGGHNDQSNVGFNDVAVFYKALSFQTISNLYAVGGATQVIILNAAPDPSTPGNLLLTWTTGTLQEATVVTGPYTDVTGSPSSPYSVPMTDSQHYYRLRN